MLDSFAVLKFLPDRSSVVYVSSESDSNRFVRGVVLCDELTKAKGLHLTGSDSRGEGLEWKSDHRAAGPQDVHASCVSVALINDEE
jgi:hypothetical protein